MMSCAHRVPSGVHECPIPSRTVFDISGRQTDRPRVREEDREGGREGKGEWNA